MMHLVLMFVIVLVLMQLGRTLLGSWQPKTATGLVLILVTAVVVVLGGVLGTLLGLG